LQSAQPISALLFSSLIQVPLQLNNASFGRLPRNFSQKLFSRK